jgi:Flp pilus assembly protein TadD
VEVLSQTVAEAKAALKAGDAMRAWSLLESVKSEGWDDGEYLTLLGAACCMSGRCQDAIAAFERGLQVAPSAQGHFNLGQAYQTAGNIEEAKVCYSRALALDPSYPHAVHALEALRPKDESHPHTAPPGGRHVEYADGPHLDGHAHLLTGPPDQ